MKKPKKTKFNPIVTKIKLNPEQAVLTCDCFDNNRRSGGGCGYANIQVCSGRTHYTYTWANEESYSSAS